MLENVTDITTLKAFSEYKAATDNLGRYNEEKGVRERQISDLFEQSKAKKQAAASAKSFSEAEKLESEAADLKQKAKSAQKELDTWKSNQPHHANLRSEKINQLKQDGKKFISEKMELAVNEINAAVEVLQAINASRNKFNPPVHWIPNIDSILSDLQSAKTQINQIKS